MTAVNAAGESVRSTTASAARPVPVPGQVTGLVAVGSQTGIGLSWTASSAAGLTGYNVYRSSSAGGTFTKLNSAVVTAASYSDASAPAGATSYYQVTAVNAAGESVASATASAARPVPVPGQVSGLTATASQAGIALSWTASSATGLTGYNVYRSSSAGGTFTKLNSAVVTSASYADEAAPAGATSYYQVTAVNAAGESARSATASAARPLAVPGQVSGLTATGSQAGIGLSWSASSAAGLTGYNVYRSSSATGTYTKLNSAVLTAASYTDAAAPAGATSYYQVTAVNAAGESARSATASAARPAGSQPIVRLNAGGPAVTASGRTWAACSAVGAACSNRVTGGFAHSESDTITGIPAGMTNAIFQSEWTGGAAGGVTVPVGQRAFGFAVPVVNGSYQVRLHFAELNKTAAGQRTFDVRLENATVLSNFDVWSQAGGIDRAITRTFNTYGDGRGRDDRLHPTCREREGQRHRDHPAGCGGSRSGDRAGRQRICLREQPDLERQPRRDLEGYRVYRSSSATGTYTRLNTALVTGTSYADTAAPAGATSYYQLTAVDLSGNESARSATVVSTPPAAVRPTIRLNAGGPAVTASGTTWAACSAVGAACSNRVTGGYAYSENDTITGIPAGMSNTIFQSEWNGGAVGTGVVRVGQRAFGFSVPVTNGAYQVRLHFAELNKSGAGQRTFDVRLENSTVLSNFAIWASAGGIDRAITRSFNASVTDGVMTIDFIRRVQNAKVSAIEIIPVG